MTGRRRGQELLEADDPDEETAVDG